MLRTDGVTPQRLIAAANDGHTVCLQMLVKAKANIKATNEEGCTALILAANHGHTACLQLLLEANADFSATDNDGHTALMTATRQGHTACVQLLVDVKHIIEKKAVEPQRSRKKKDCIISRICEYDVLRYGSRDISP